MLTFGLGTILYVSLLLTNAIAILSHDRFLVPLGLSHTNQGGVGSVGGTPGYGYDSYGGAQGMVQEGPGVKARLVTLVGAVRTLMRIPLIPLNIVVIIYELLLG